MTRYYIGYSFSWKCAVEEVMRDIEKLEYSERSFYRELLENTVNEPFPTDEEYEKLDEAIAAFLTLLKGYYPQETLEYNYGADEFHYTLNKLGCDRVFTEILQRNHCGCLSDRDFDLTASIHLFRKDDVDDPIYTHHVSYHWGNILDIMVASYDSYAFKSSYAFKNIPEEHTVTCCNLDKLSPTDRDDILCYVGVDAERGPKTFHVSHGLSSENFDRVPLIYELARDMAEVAGYKRPQELVAFENLLRSYMKDYGLSMADDDLYGYNAVKYDDDIDDEEEQDPRYPFNRLYLLPRVYFLLKESVSREILEKCDADGYYWTPRERRRYIPYEDGYAIEYISRQHLKEMENQTDLPPYLRYTY